VTVTGLVSAVLLLPHPATPAPAATTAAATVKNDPRMPENFEHRTR
jgi:hypothetical protein